MRLRMLTANSTAEVFPFSSEDGGGLRASVIWCQKNAERASLVENASAATLRSARCSGEK